MFIAKGRGVKGLRKKSDIKRSALKLELPASLPVVSSRFINHPSIITAL
jgi:hypothetical protein